MSRELVDFLTPFVSEHKLALFEEYLQHRTRHITVAIENIYQPHNASAVLRSCDCFGVQDVYVIENSNEYTINPQVALGASQWLDLHRYNEKEENTVRCINDLKTKGYRIVATTPHKNDQLISELNIDTPVALLFGTEKGGLSETAMEQADEFVKIPMYGFTESYNISVSAAITLYELTERLRKSDINWQLSEEERAAIHLAWVKEAIPHAEKIEREFYRRQSGG